MKLTAQDLDKWEKQAAFIGAPELFRLARLGLWAEELEAELEAYRVEHCKQRFGRNK
jgi:hypothetical protein